MLTPQTVPLVEPERGPVSAPVERVIRGIDDVVGRPLDHLGAAVLGADLVQLRKGIDRLEAEFIRRLDRFDVMGGPEAEGATSVTSWMRAHCGLSAAGSAQRAEIAAKLPDIPGAEARFQSGEIAFGHAVALARTVNEVGPEAARIVGPQLLDAAQRVDPDRLRLMGKHVRQVVDPKGALADAIRAHQRRRLQLSRSLDGTFFIEGLLDAEGGELVKTAVDALMTPVPGDERTAAQRRADALVELATRQLQRGELPTTRGQRPHLIVTASVETVDGRSGARGGDINGTTVVPTETVQRIACDAEPTEVVIAADGTAVEVGPAKRTIPAHVRKQVELRDRICIFPGCDRTAAWCDIHHFKPRAHGGDHDLNNLGLLCRWHHTWVHERGWSIRRTETGKIVVAPP